MHKIHSLTALDILEVVAEEELLDDVMDNLENIGIDNFLGKKVNQLTIPPVINKCLILVRLRVDSIW